MTDVLARDLDIKFKKSFVSNNANARHWLYIYFLLNFVSLNCIAKFFNLNIIIILQK